jgi:Tfp pilus assembly protein PilW
MKSLVSNHSGFTMVEALVSAAIFTFLIGGLVTTMIAGHASWDAYNANVQVQQEVRKALSLMTRDFRVAQGVNITTGAGILTVTFSHPQDGSVTYNWSDTGSDAKRLLRQTSTATRIVSQNISAVNVTNNADNFVIDVTANVPTERGGEVDSFQLSTEVAKR